ncbi:MAG: undecaprenyl-diphosphate phosphatase [bacterium]|nr:undecaprenyl-diphosphate phosphatase [bacterium]
MNIVQAGLLGLIQGLTEFLPVSSSAHLVLAQSFIPGFSQPGVLFDVVLHGGTLLAVLWYFRKRLLSLDRKMLALLVLGTIPAGIAGIVLKDFLENLFTGTKTLGYELIITGFLCWGIDKWKTNSDGKSKQVNWFDSLLIGIFQAIAIIPGISRSGATIFGGIIRGIDKKEAAVFSFLLSIPAIGGAIVLEGFSEAKNVQIDLIPQYAIGFLVALVVGYLSIGILLRFIVENKFKYFAYYCWLLGTFVLISKLI